MNLTENAERHKRVQAVRFHLREVQEQAKAVCGDRGQKSGRGTGKCPGRRKCSLPRAG